MSSDLSAPQHQAAQSSETKRKRLQPHIRPFNGETDAGLVLTTWRESRQPMEVLRRLLRRQGLDVRCMVAALSADPGDSLYGWAAAETGGAVIWAYTVNAARRMGVMTALLDALGVDLAGPVACRFWSPTAEAISAVRPLRFAPVKSQRLAGVALTRSEQDHLLKAVEGAANTERKTA